LQKTFSIPTHYLFQSRLQSSFYECCYGHIKFEGNNNYSLKKYNTAKARCTNGCPRHMFEQKEEEEEEDKENGKNKRHHYDKYLETFKLSV
jgi:hypothetical protein